METIETIELKLGENLKLMPVNVETRPFKKRSRCTVCETSPFKLDLETIADRGHILLDDIKTSQKNVPDIPMLFVKPNEAYLKAATRVYDELNNI